MRFLAWGSNFTGAIDPSSADQIIKEPRDVTENIDCEEILWVGWAGTVGRGELAVDNTDSVSENIRVWGSFDATRLDTGAVKKILGFDSVIAYLDANGHISDFSRKSSTIWDDASISGLGIVYAYKRNDGLYRFTSLDQFFANESDPVTHPAFNPHHPAAIYSMESRAFVHSTGPMQQLFEIRAADEAAPATGQGLPYLDPIEDLEGMELKIIPGPCNRLGIITDAGSAYILEKRSQEVALLDAPGDVSLLGLGSDFEVVVVDGQVLVRGNNEFGQLGRADAQDFAYLLKGIVADIKCSRWSTILTMQ